MKPIIHEEDTDLTRAWVPKGGAGGSSGARSKLDGAGTEGEPQVVDKHNAPTGMLELANAWWQTNNLLQQARLDVARLPRLIADEEAQLRKGGLYTLVHLRNLAKAKEELETAKELVRSSRADCVPWNSNTTIQGLTSLSIRRGRRARH